MNVYEYIYINILLSAVQLVGCGGMRCMCDPYIHLYVCIRTYTHMTHIHSAACGKWVMCCGDIYTSMNTYVYI